MFVNLIRAALMVAAVLVAAAPARAQTAEGARAALNSKSPVVIELFTSQGCSACPAADALFKEFVGREDVIALSMPVDYWDYLGWKDTLANPKFAKRQRAYAALRGDGKVYTPQAVVNGRQHVIGSARTEIEAAIAGARAGLVTGPLHASIVNSTISIDMPKATEPTEDTTVWLAVVQAETRVEVRAGENRGKSLIYYNIVRELVPLGLWSGAATTIRQQVAAVSGSAADRYAVFLQKGVGGPILAAAWVGLEP